MATAEERLVEWLRDAHAMEEQAEKMLRDTASRIENYPELKARLESHASETHRQAELLEGCLKRRGASASTMKDLTGKLTALGQGLSGMFVTDEVVKASMASYTFEHMEIAAYRSLIATAEAAGDHETKQICQQILAEEEAMASWMGENISSITRRYLDLDAQHGTTAKH
ncbi:ferritin-like metal-binding protein YciE [Constrictibacter sp. MBR-5]|jgi:ferritin-like metal-binding protein YciE|uniref:ferritin-like domain-containing protein n=1 Tax=Constrictibacter sp. MBR-5 TaxID=3156467 RepID=UPI00339B0B91